MAQILLYYNVGRKNKLCIYAGRKPTRRRYRRVLYFLAATPYSTTFCRETWHNRVAEAANDVTFDFSSGFYNCFPITGCRIRRFLCGIHHRRFWAAEADFQHVSCCIFYASPLVYTAPCLKRCQLLSHLKIEKIPVKKRKKAMHRESQLSWKFLVSVIAPLKPNKGRLNSSLIKWYSWRYFQCVLELCR